MLYILRKSKDRKRLSSFKKPSTPSSARRLLRPYTVAQYETWRGLHFGCMQPFFSPPLDPSVEERERGNREKGGGYESKSARRAPPPPAFALLLRKKWGEGNFSSPAHSLTQKVHFREGLSLSPRACSTVFELRIFFPETFFFGRRA